MADVLLLSLGTTKGLRVADAGFAELLREAGASVALVATRIGAAGRLRRGYPVNDVVEAAAARRALADGLARERPRAVILSTTTAGLLAPAPGLPLAIRFDAPAALNRPGARNAVVRRLERRSMARAHLLLPTSTVAAAAVPRGAAEAVVVQIPVRAGSPPADAPRERVAVAYVPDPRAKGLDVLCGAWSATQLADAELHVFGIDPDAARAFLARRGIAEPAGVRWRGLVAAEEFRAALRTARALVCSARWEDYGQAQLEALLDGALLVTVPSGGPYEALPLARRLDPELVAADVDPDALAVCLRRAFAREDAALAAYRAAAAGELAAYTPERARETLARDVLPRLLG